MFGHVGIREHLLNRFVEAIDGECDTLCQRGNTSVFRKIPIKDFPTFTWISCISELEVKAPILHKIVSKIVSKSDHRNKLKQGDRHYPGICMALAALLKERNREMNGLQTFVSLILFSSRVQKQVNKQ